MVTTPSFYNLKDQGIYAAGDFFIPQEKYRAAPYNVNQPNNPDEVPAGIPAVYQSQGGGGGGALQAGDPMTNFNNFYDYTSNKYFSKMPTPFIDALPESMRAKTFMGFPSYREQELTGPDMGEYIASGTDIPLELTTAGKIQQGLGSAKEGLAGLAEKFKGIGPISAILGSMDKFDTLPELDQAFIKANMGYTGPTVFGENTSGLSKDPFGRNVRSAFGNYAEKVRDDFSNLSTALSPTGKIGSKKEYQGATFNPETGLFESDDEDLADYANKMTKMVRSKYMFDKKAIAQQKFNEKIAEANKKAEEARAAQYGKTDYGRGSDGQQSYSGDAIGAGNLGFGVGATTGGPVSNRTGRGRQDYMDGGLADLLEIYD